MEKKSSIILHVCFSQHKNKIGKSGELIVTSEVSRYQMRNLANCLQKIRDMIAEATETPKVVSKENVQAIRNRYESTQTTRHPISIHLWCQLAMITYRYVLELGATLLCC